MVDEFANCYYTLGVIHQEHLPTNDRIGLKITYVIPKQICIDTVFGFDDRLVQNQIRTFDMDKVASFGLTVYWDVQKEKSRDVMQNDLKAKFQLFKSLTEINVW